MMMYIIVIIIIIIIIYNETWCKRAYGSLSETI